MKKTGTLFLVPTTISQKPLSEVLPKYTLDVIKNLELFICENTKTSRNHIKDLTQKPVQEIKFFQIDKHKRYTKKEIEKLIKPLTNGQDMGLISEAGCPGVADPGSELILYCHRANIRVVPLIGPSSLLMALMASGLNGQHFKFIGYLSKDSTKRVREIRNLEKESQKRETTMIIMETPYRIEYVWKDLINNCNEKTLITLSMDITSENEYIQTATALQWQNMKWPKFNKNQVIFLIQAK